MPEAFSENMGLVDTFQNVVKKLIEFFFYNYLVIQILPLVLLPAPKLGFLNVVESGLL